MSRLLLVLLALTATGCTFNRSGSQTIEVDLNGARPANDSEHVNGEPRLHSRAFVE